MNMIQFDLRHVFLDGLETQPPTQGHVFTIPIRSPAGLPGNYFLASTYARSVGRSSSRMVRLVGLGYFKKEERSSDQLTLIICIYNYMYRQYRDI